MRIRREVKKKAFEKPTIQVVLVESAGMVTLDAPTASLEGARNAFVRLRPSEALGREEVTAWANVVRPLARAVRILPARRSALVPGASTRLNVDSVIGTVREEVYDLVRAENDPDLHTVVEKILSEVER